MRRRLVAGHMMVNKCGDPKGKQCVKTMLNAASCELEVTYMEAMPFNSAIVLSDSFRGCFLPAGFVFILHVFRKVNALLILVSRTYSYYGKNKPEFFIQAQPT